MKTLILDGAIGDDSTGTGVNAALIEELRTLGARVESERIAEKHS